MVGISLQHHLSGNHGSIILVSDSGLGTQWDTMNANGDKKKVFEKRCSKNLSRSISKSNRKMFPDDNCSKNKSFRVEHEKIYFGNFHRLIS